MKKREFKIHGVRFETTRRLNERRMRVGITWPQAAELGIAYKESSKENILAQFNKEEKKSKKRGYPESQAGAKA